MKGKEALERLFGSYVRSKCYGINNKQDDEDYELIKQDLEILNILKDNIMIDEEEKFITLFSKNKEVVEKVKEWLYRE